jgi:hypothetical protein
VTYRGKHVLAYITGSVDQELLVRNAYLVTENRILRQQITGCIRLSDGERKTLAAIGKKLGSREASLQRLDGGNILKHHGIPPAPKRKKTTTWQELLGEE